jgi:hypothetical protein
MPSYTYNDISQTFENSKCELLTTENEFIELLQETKPSNVKLNIIASCGHNNIVIFKNFKFRNAGVLCKDCKNKKLSVTLKEKIYDNTYVRREIDCTKNFQSLINEQFESILTNEGCESDLIIKLRSTDDNKWLRIQVKLTENICEYDKVYRFCIHNTYKNHIIICHCIQRDLYWLIPGGIISSSKISIGQYGGKYFEYYTKKESIQDKLVEYYNNTVLYQKEECMIPKSISNIKEYIYRQKIYNYLSFLKIETSEYTNMVYDLIINNKKVQEKVMTIDTTKQNKYCTSLYKRKGTKNFQTYNCFDNDLYWFHIPETDFFYVIPEYELYSRGFISLYEQAGKKGFHVNTDYHAKSCNKWTIDYIFDYTNIDHNKLRDLLNVDYIDIMNSIIFNKMMKS